MVGNVTIQGQIVGTATFDGAKISAVVTVSPPINATVVFGKSGVTVHNELTGRDADDVHPKESIIGLKLADSPEFANTQITKLDSVENGGVIPNVEATWLGATAKSVVSYLQKLVSKVYAINSRVEVLENNVIFDITTTQNVASVAITTDKNGNPINFVDGDCFTLILSGGLSTTSQLLSIRLNDIATSDYINAAVSTVFGYSGSQVTRLEVNFIVTTKSILAAGKTNRCNADYTGIVQTSTFASTKDNSIPLPITKINILASIQINAGTRIMIRKC